VEEKTPMTGKGRSERKVPENQPALLTSGLTELCSIHPDPDVSRTVPWSMGSRGRETMMTALMSRSRVVIGETWKRELIGIFIIWAEDKVGRHLMRAQGLKGRGWRRWSKEWLFEKIGLFDDYRIRRYEPLAKALPAG
jgi:hypothetical protein